MRTLCPVARPPKLLGRVLQNDPGCVNLEFGEGGAGGLAIEAATARVLVLHAQHVAERVAGGAAYSHLRQRSSAHIRLSDLGVSNSFSQPKFIDFIWPQ